MIGGKHACLAVGRRCNRPLDRNYHRYGFHCHNGRLSRRKTTRPLPTVPAEWKVTSIAVPDGGEIAVGEGAVWVASFGARTVSRIDPQTNRVVATVRVGEGAGNDLHPGGVITAGVGGVWAAGFKESNAVYRIDPATNRVVATVRVGPTGDAPLELAVGLGAVWVSQDEQEAGSIVRIDPLTNDARRIVDVAPKELGPGIGPGLVAAGDDWLWVQVGGFTNSRESYNKLLRIDPRTQTIVGETSPICGFLAPDAGAVWALDCTGALKRVDAATNSVTLDVPLEPVLGGVAATGGITLGLGSVWARILRVGGTGPGTLLRIDPATGAVTARISLAAVLSFTGFELRQFAAVDVGFGSVWLRERGRVLRIDPAP